MGCIQNIIGAKVASTLTQRVPRMILLVLTFVIAALLLFLLAWFVAGCYWVFRSWKIVQYDDPEQGDYCHPFLYRFAYWMLLLTLIIKLLAFVHSSARAPTQLRSFRNSSASTPATGLWFAPMSPWIYHRCTRPDYLLFISSINSPEHFLLLLPVAGRTR